MEEQLELYLVKNPFPPQASGGDIFSKGETMNNIMDRTTLMRFGMMVALALGVAFLTSSHANAEQFVAGGIKAATATSQPAPVFSAVSKDGKTYSVAMAAPYAVYFEDPQVPGVAAQDDTNPLHSCKACVWVVPFI
jgi:hypothetical protein